MSREQVSGLIQKLEQTLASNNLATVPDQQLVTRFTTACDETAFRVIAARHGPMVYRVCRRVLRNEQDVEDAFQATFLVFVRKAGSIRKLKSLASWLHGVAYQVSLRMRTSSQRQRDREVLVAERDETAVTDDMSWKEVRSIVDEELTRLPEQMREPLVLCYLEGLTQDEAATQLGLSIRTLQRRLEHGRDRLGARLTRRGLGLSAALTASLLSECVVAMPPALTATTASLVQDVLGGKSLSVLSHRLTALTQEVIESMFSNRLNVKWLVVALLGMGLATAAIGTQFSNEQLPETPVPLTSEIKKDNKVDAKPESPPADGILWGEAVEGLKAGISFRTGEDHSSRLGGSVTFVVYLRNESKNPISISHNENVFDEFLPSVQDANGKKVTVFPGPIFLGLVSRVDRTLYEGETIRLGTAWFLIKGTSWRGTVVSPTLRAEPGKYRVSCANFPFRRKGKDSDEMLWSTGWVDLTIESEAQGVIPKSRNEEKGKEKENSADMLAAEVEKLKNTGGEFRSKAIEAAKEYLALESAQIAVSAKADSLRKAAAMFRLADNPTDAVAALQAAIKLPKLPDELAGNVLADFADALIATKQPSEVQRAFNVVVSSTVTISMKNRFRLANHLKEERQPELRLLACNLLEQIAKQTDISPAEQEIHELSLRDLAREHIRNNDFATAEVWLRQQLHTYPTGPQATYSKFLLGICLLQLATVPNPVGPATSKAHTQREEALRLFRAIVSEEDAKLKKDGKLSDHDAWLKVQAAIRVLQAHLHMKNHTELLYESQDLLQRQRGTVEELIIWSLIYKSFEQQRDEVKKLQTRDMMKELFDSLPASAFNSSAVEYTREYWEKSWFSPVK
ncbi:MAG TPA: RNA polymerase sigma factor [Gemmata sp.]|jgi:RNA polymerase sigma factor (sigma-70 family)|nr:RNA polymerase sigma factor [Gemmata sp.]